MAQSLPLNIAVFPGDGIGVEVGVCGGTFDYPNWFDRNQGMCRHIFTKSAQEGVLLPPNMDTYEAHALQNDGTPNQPVVFAHAVMARQDS